MDLEGIRNFLYTKGCSHIKATGSQVSSSCPFAPELHEGGTDKHPSFTVKIDPYGNSVYFCFACLSRGTIEYLSRKNGNRNNGYKTNGNIVQQINGIGDYQKHKKNDTFIKELDENILEQFSKKFPKSVVQYMLDRGLVKKSVQDFELCFDKKHWRVIFPVRNRAKDLVGIGGRIADDFEEEEPKFLYYSYDRENKKMCPYINHNSEVGFLTFQKSKFLYGENLAFITRQNMNMKYNSLFVVEGQMDVIKMRQMEFNAVGLMGCYPSKAQVERIIDLVPEKKHVFILMDPDKAGRKAARKLACELRKNVPFMVLNLPEGTDPGMATEKMIFDAYYKRGKNDR